MAPSPLPASTTLPKPPALGMEDGTALAPGRRWGHEGWCKPPLQPAQDSILYSYIKFPTIKYTDDAEQAVPGSWVPHPRGSTPKGNQKPSKGSVGASRSTLSPGQTQPCHAGSPVSKGFSACSSSQQEEEKKTPPKFFQATVMKPQSGDRHFPSPKQPPALPSPYPAVPRDRQCWHVPGCCGSRGCSCIPGVFQALT